MSETDITTKSSTPTNWLITPSHVDTALDDQRKAMDFLDNLASVDDEPRDIMAQYSGTDLDRSFFGSHTCYRPYIIKNGVLKIPVEGLLLHKFPYATRYATGYEFICQSIMHGYEDEEVEEIALMIDSPGGMVKGLFELSDMIYEMRGEKPITAYVTGTAYSAAYAIACAADEVVMSKMAEAGSIGVVTVHTSMADMLQTRGIDVTVVRSNEPKFETNPYEKLSEAARNRIQESVDRLYSVFTSTVARNRDMPEDEVIETDALTFPSEKAIELKLADRIGTLSSDMSIGDPETAEDNSEQPEEADTGDDQMAKENKTEVTTFTQEDLDAARAQGASSERERFSAVQGSEAYAGRESLATHLLSNTTMSADDIVSALEAVPATQPAPEAPSATESGQQTWTPPEPNGAAFSRAMEETGNPEIPAAEPATPNMSEDQKAFEELSAARAQIA